VQTESPTENPATPPVLIADGSGPRRQQVATPEVFGNIFIGIAGMIGAGKSTLATALGKHLGIDTYYEPVADNEYLEDFYRDTAKYSFAMQVYLLNRRFQQHQEIIWRGKSAVQDRTIYEDSIFAKMLARTGLMDQRDYKTYVELFRNMSNFMCKPSVIIFLDVSPEGSAERIRMRSRDVEQKIELGYLQALYDGYQEFVDSISKVIPVIRVDYERFATAEEMAARRVRRRWPQIRAGLIAFAIVLGLIEGAPIPPLHEADPWQRGYVEAIAPVQRAVLAPFAWIPRHLHISQRWALFQAARPERYRLEVIGVTAGGTSRLLYRAGDAAHQAYADVLEFRRVRGVYNPTTNVPGQYGAFTTWFAARVFADHPDVGLVRFQMEKVRLDGGVVRGTGEYLFVRHVQRGAR